MSNIDKLEEKSIKVREWIYHGELGGIAVLIIALFLFVHNENIHVNDRLDSHIEAINRRCDELHKRSDDLHREFYELLKEMRK